MSILTTIADMRNQFAKNSGEYPRYMYMNPHGTTWTELNKEFYGVTKVLDMEVKLSLVCPTECVYLSIGEIEVHDGSKNGSEAR